MKVKSLFFTLLTGFLFSQETWNVDANGNWGTPANWTPAVVPNAVGATATFGSVITANRLITLDISPTVGTLAFDNANNYQIGPSGATFLTLSVSSGNAAINITNVNGNGAHSITAPVTLTNNLLLTQGSTSPFTLMGVISGGGSLTTAGAGTVILSGVNTYSGGTTITAGTLQAGIANALPPTGTVTVSGGVLNLANFNQSTGPIAGSGNITLGTASLTTTSATTTTYSGIMSGIGGSLTLAGTGTLILTNNNTYSAGTTITGGTLQIGINNALLPTGNVVVTSPGTLNLTTFSQTVANLSGTGSILLGTGAVLSVNTSVPSTFSGVISGAGALTQLATATSTFTLSGNNTYTGGTTVSGGTVQLGTNNALASTGPVTLNGGVLDMSLTTQQSIGTLSGTTNITLGGAAVTINETTSSTYSGSITGGAGSLTFQGPATLTLGGVSTFTGGTTINGGILQLGISNALATTGSLTVNAPGTFNLANFNQTIGAFSGSGNVTLGTGILTINSAATTTFSGPISGVGGSLVYQGPGMLTLSGTNTYSGGTTVSGGTLQGNTSSLQGSITNNATLIFNQAFSGTYSGLLTGTGALIITGGGSLTLTGAQTQNSTTVSAGQLIIGAGDLLTSPVTVAAGASLAGSGTIAGNVTNNGTLQLGLNNLTIIGAYAQGAGSSFNVEVNPSTSGLLSVTGATGITSPASLVVTVDPGIYGASTLYTLITSGAPVTGTFDPPTFANPFFIGSLIYNGIAPGSVQLNLEIAPFSNVIQGGNAGAIAKCINLQAFPSESDLLPILQSLIFLPVGKVRDALDAMQPSQLKAVALAEENNIVLARTAISQRIDEMYKTNCNQCMSEMYNWNIWSNISGDFLKQESQRENVGFEATTGTAAVGIDTAVAKNVFIGAAGVYNYSWFDWEHSKGDATISSFYTGPYLSYFNRRTVLNLSTLASWNDYHVTRHINFPTIDRHARSKHRGMGLISHLDFGVMLYPTRGMSFTPFGGLDYIHLSEKKYTEEGAGSLNLQIKATHASLLRSELGLKIAKCAAFEHTTWTHDLKLSWIHQHPFQSAHLKAKFREVACTFTVEGLEPSQDYFNVATGLTGVFIKDKLSAALRYEGKFGDGIHDNTAYLQLIYRY